LCERAPARSAPPLSAKRRSIGGNHTVIEVLDPRVA
jgi:hypothetical protein